MWVALHPGVLDDEGPRYCCSSAVAAAARLGHAEAGMNDTSDGGPAKPRLSEIVSLSQGLLARALSSCPSYCWLVDYGVETVRVSFAIKLKPLMRV